MFKEPTTQTNFSKLDEAINQWWKENDTFAKSVAKNPVENSYVFYDGPPFMSGEPHYGSLLSSMAKDIFPRYQTMQGKRVERLWGWDCHGLPIEQKVEDQLNIKGREAVIAYGLDAYIQHCYSWNRIGIDSWRWYIEKVGRWADIDNAYRTMDQDYMESVWCTFSQMWEKGLVYKGLRTSLYSTDSSTPVSDFEVTMDADNYRDTVDTAVTIMFKLAADSLTKLPITTSGDVFLAAWTTTPWTLPSNFALAVKADAEYITLQVTSPNGQMSTVIMGKDAYLERNFLTGSEWQHQQVGGSFKGELLAGLSYAQLYPFHQGGQNDFKVYTSDYVTTTDGTGILHVAPAYGEADFQMGQQWKLSFTGSIDDKGMMNVGPWAGKYLRGANSLIVQDLIDQGRLLKQEQYTHRLPYYRYKNPLIYRTMENVFVDIQKLKPQLFANAEKINWVPEHFRSRFTNVIETAPDWCISRNRFWGTAMPLWESPTGSQIVIASRDQLMLLVNQSGEVKIQKIVLSLDTQDLSTYPEKLASLQSAIDSKETTILCQANQTNLSQLRATLLGETAAESIVKPITSELPRAYYLFNTKPLDLHRPYIDAVTFSQNGEQFTRVEYTLDVWLDSGSMPFAQFHYPFEGKAKFEANFPGDFISEYTGQIRAWFNVLHVISTAVYGQNAFKNVLVSGVLAGTDGRKMSKSFGNYPDPKATLAQYGGDALRLYLLGSPLMVGGDINFSEEEVKAQARDFLLPLWNMYKFLTSYANMHNWEPKSELALNKRNAFGEDHPWSHIPFGDVANELDAWVLLMLQETIGEVTTSLDSYNAPQAIRVIKKFLDEMSRWYIRRSRERFTAGDERAMETLYYCLIEICKLSAPITPFITEEIYRILAADQHADLPESVHLTDYPVVDLNFITQYSQLVAEMELTRTICELGQNLRTTNSLKVKQPLRNLQIKFSLQDNQEGMSLNRWMEELIREELNIKDIIEVPALSTDLGWLATENATAGISIALNTNLDQELINEGHVREIIRGIQALRKEQGFQLGQLVKIDYFTTSQQLMSLLTAHNEQIMRGTSAAKLAAATNILGHTISINSEDLTVTLSAND